MMCGSVCVSAGKRVRESERERGRARRRNEAARSRLDLERVHLEQLRPFLQILRAVRVLCKSKEQNTKRRRGRVDEIRQSDRNVSRRMIEELLNVAEGTLTKPGVM
eukprot:6203539-Pleurochrysis_carterae.AAC.5